MISTLAQGEFRRIFRASLRDHSAGGLCFQKSSAEVICTWQNNAPPSKTVALAKVRFRRSALDHIALV